MRDRRYDAPGSRSPGGAAIRFNQPGDDLRTNTDLASRTLFASARVERGALDLRAFILNVRANRGIAPEEHRDPLADSPRYWRYPEIAQTQVGATARFSLATDTSLKITGWHQRFAQVIDQYRDASYKEVRTRQTDDDTTLGGRVVATRAWPDGALRLVATALTSRHAQIDAAVPGVGAALLRYRQTLLGLGAETDVRLGKAMTTLGLNYARSINPLTGDKPPHPDADALSFSGAVRLPLPDSATLTVSGGPREPIPLRTRTFRRSARAFSAEHRPSSGNGVAGRCGATLVGPRAELFAQPLHRAGHGRDRTAGCVVGTRRLRQRYNVPGATRTGVEGSVSGSVSTAIDLEIGAMVMRARADEGAAAFRSLPQRPAYEWSSTITYRTVGALSLRLDYHRVGPSRDIDTDGGSVRLPPGGSVGLGARLRIATTRARSRLWVVGAIDNLFDTAIFPQLGLPLPGRMLRIGLQLD